jgi:two-component system, chemotaxis family, CheB/CheR fusion protein
VLQVRDTGVGIAPDLLPRIFDLFTQADRSLDRAQGGLGVGLTIVQRVVEMHGGRVEASSAGPGQGSEFTVYLPIAAPPTVRYSPARESVAASQSLRVLVVDDNVDTADSAGMLLRESGHDVQIAYSAKTALDAAVAFRPDVVLLDIGLPETDGYEVARRLRRTPELKNAWLIAVTGYGRDADRQHSEDAGFDAHMVKPVDLEKVKELLSMLMKRHGSVR